MENETSRSIAAVFTQLNSTIQTDGNDSAFLIGLCFHTDLFFCKGIGLTLCLIANGLLPSAGTPDVLIFRVFHITADCNTVRPPPDTIPDQKTGGQQAACMQNLSLNLRDSFPTLSSPMSSIPARSAVNPGSSFGMATTPIRFGSARLMIFLVFVVLAVPCP